MLDENHTDAYTQSVQKEIEMTLEELIAALQKAKNDKKQKPKPPGGGGGGKPGDEPLLPDSAELKLLRSAQLRVNRRTKSFHTARPESGDLIDIMRSQVRDIAHLQEEIARMAQEMAIKK